MHGTFGRRAPCELRDYHHRDVLALSSREERHMFPIARRPLQLLRALPPTRPHKIPAAARSRAVSLISDTIAHCSALFVPIHIHAATVRVSPSGDVLITITPVAPDARYSAPEVHFGFAPCAIWSIACLLYKLITGSPLVRPHENAPRAALRLVGTLTHKFHRLGALFDALDSSQKWANLAPRLRSPSGATAPERAFLARALTWSRDDMHVRAGGIFCSSALGTIVE